MSVVKGFDQTTDPAAPAAGENLEYWKAGVKYKISSTGGAQPIAPTAPEKAYVLVSGRCTITSTTFTSWPNNYGFNGQDWNGNTGSFSPTTRWSGIRMPWDGKLTACEIWQYGWFTPVGAEIRIVKSTWIADNAAVPVITQLGAANIHAGGAGGGGPGDIVMDLTSNNSVSKGEMIFPIIKGNASATTNVAQVSALFTLEADS